MKVELAAAAIAVALTSCTGTTPPHSTAQRIGKLEQVIGGPHAVGEIGDFLLENDQIRLIVSDKSFQIGNTTVAAGRVNTTFGGSLIDADLQRPGGPGLGNDELAELLPGFVFTVINPTDVSITADGADGGAAEVTVTGNGGDLYESVALLNTGLVFPAMLQMTQVYRLEPGKRYVTIETTIKNTSTGAHPFPYLNPSQLDNLLGMDIPGISSLHLSAPLGQFPLLGGEQELFAPGVAGFNVRFAIQDTYSTAGGFPAFPGMAIDFLASRGPGVSYGLTIPKTDDNYVNAFASGYPGQDVTPYSMLLPFTYAGVTAAYMYNPPAQLNAGEQRTYTSYFVIGKGDVGSVADAIYDLRAQPTGTFGGRVLDERTDIGVPNANVIVMDGKNHPIDQLQTDAGGNFLGHLPPGQYTYEALTDDRLASDPVPITITAGEQTGALVLMHSPATIAVSVLDELGRRAPVKIQLLGHSAAIQGAGVDGRNILYSLALGERVRPTAFDGTDRYVENAWWTKDGLLEVTVRPGTYDIVVTRGPEYEITTKTVSVDAGSYATAQLALTRSYTSDGWIAGDFHIHAQPSTDSGLPIPDRVTTCAAEGLEVAVATDHNYITDYSPVIANLALDQWLFGIPGMEMTTFEMGHFIGYPLKVDPGSTRGGEFEWARQTPQQIFDTLRRLAIDPTNSIVDIAHPRQAVLGYFAQFFVDSLTAEPYTPTGITGVFAPYGDEFQAQNFSYDFDAMELFTGRRIEDVHTFRAPTPLPPGPFPDPQPVSGQIVVGKDGRPTFPGVVETWFTLLDRGMTPTGLGASDSHHTLGDEPGYARTLLFVGSGHDVPGGVTRDEIIAAIKGHHAIVTNSPFIEMTIDDHMIGDTIVDKTGSVTVNLHVHAPSWGAVNHLVVYSNSVAVYDQPVPAPGTDYTTTVAIPLTKDAWVVAEVTGVANLFPVVSPTEFPPLDVSAIIGALSVGLDLSSLPIASKLQPIKVHTTTPYAITNPIWIDTDGDGFTPPQAVLPRKLAGHSVRPDVRAQFNALPDVSQ